MPLPRLLTLTTLALAEAALAQGRPPAANRRPEPAPACLVSEFRALGLGTHDVAERGKKASEWLQRNLPGCGEEQLRLLNSNRSAWLGTADSMQLMFTIDSALEARLKNRPEQVAAMFGASAPPPRPPGSDTVRATDLAPRPNPVMGNAPAAPMAAPTPVVVAPPPGAKPAPPPGPGGAPAPTPAPAPAPGSPPVAKPPEVGKHFSAALRTAIRDYFVANRGTGACPEGLTRKGSNCVSPTEQRAWKLGQPLAGGGNTKELPARLVQAVGPAPAGHKYVLVDGDLLLIAEATGTVVDAVLDFGGVPAKT